MVAHSATKNIKNLEIEKLFLILSHPDENVKQLIIGRRTRGDKVQRSATISRMFLIIDYFPSVRLPLIWSLTIRNIVPNRDGFYRLIGNKIKY